MPKGKKANKGGTGGRPSANQQTTSGTGASASQDPSGHQTSTDDLDQPMAEVPECHDCMRQANGLKSEFLTTEKIFSPVEARESVASSNVHKDEDASIPKPVSAPKASLAKGKPAGTSSAGSAGKLGSTTGAGSQTSIILPRRPAYSKAGRNTQSPLRTNSFHLVPQDDLEIHKYTVTVPNLSNLAKEQKALMRKRRRLFELLLEEITSQDKGVRIATDYASILLTTKKLNVEKDSIDIVYRDECQAQPDQWRWPTKMSLKKEFSIGLGALLEYLGKPYDPHSDVDKPGCLQALNIIVRQRPNANPGIFSGALNTEFYSLLGESAQLSNCVVALKGYETSVKTSVSRLLVNVHACSSAFYQEGPVIKVMDTLGRDPAESFLKKCRIRTMYTGGKRFRTIRGYARDTNSSQPRTAANTYIERSGNAKSESRTITIEAYFLERYGITIMKPNYPLLDLGVVYIRGKEDTSDSQRGTNALSNEADNAKSHIDSNSNEQVDETNGSQEGPKSTALDTKDGKKKQQDKKEGKERAVLVPAELCYVVPGQIFKPKLDDTQTSKMKAFAARPPAENATRIESAADTILELSRPWIQKFGLNISPQMLCVEGRGSVEEAPKGGSWNLRSAHLVETKTKPLQYWSVLRLLQSNGDPDAHQVTKAHLDLFSKDLVDCGFTNAQRVGPAAGHMFKISDSNNRETVDKELLAALKQASTPGVQIVLVLLPKLEAYVYGRIKFLADLKLGILTVCTVPSKFIKGKGPKGTADFRIMDPGYVANVAMKINMKLGGKNHTLQDKYLGPLMDESTMMVGIDVSHPSHTQLQKPKSIAGVVANTGRRNLYQWPCSLRTQEGGQETVEALDEMISERLDLWLATTKTYPKRILVYRDGVSENQYAMVKDVELVKIKEACKKVACNPEIAIIVVAKRHSTRFYPIDRRDSDLVYNPKAEGNLQAGTVIDRGITMENGWDFYLQAQHCIQGTAKPAHYVVVHNEFVKPKPLTAEGLEELTHNLCYTYGRATKAISVCPPAYYAHLACERGKVYLNKYYQYPDASPNGSALPPTWTSAIAPWTRTVHKDEMVIEKEEGKEIRRDVKKDKLADTMFYI